jgi:hypothetical protein
MLENPLLQNKGATALDAFTKEQTKVINADLDHSVRYFLIFLVLGGGAAVWVSILLTQFHALPGPLALVHVGLAATALLLVMIFQGLMIQSTQFNFLLIALEGIALPVFFYPAFSSWFVIGAFGFIAVWLSGFSRSRAMLSAVMKVNFWHYSTMVVGTSITAMALFAACLYVGLYQQAGGITFNAYKFVVSSASPGLEYVAPNFSPETNVDTFLDGTIKDYFQKQDGFSTLPAAQQQEVIKAATEGLGQRISDFTKEAMQPGDTVASYTFRWVSDGIRALQQKGFGAFVVVGIFLLIFLSIKGVMFFVQWPVLIFAFMLYLLLQAIGIISIGAEMRQKEVIIVK